MKYIFLFIILSVLTCSQKKVDDKEVEALGVTNRGERIKLEDNLYMDTEIIPFVITKICVNFYSTKIKNGKFQFFELRLTLRQYISLLEGFAENRNMNLDDQISRARNSKVLFCNLIRGYFLSTLKGSNFCLLKSDKLINFLARYNFDYFGREIKNREITDILENAYYKLNSMGWEYFMSNKYAYNDIRTFGIMELNEK